MRAGAQHLGERALEGPLVACPGEAEPPRDELRPAPCLQQPLRGAVRNPDPGVGVERQGGETHGIDLLAQLAVLGIGALQARTDLQRAREVRQQGLQQPPFAPFIGAGGGAAAQVQPRAGRAGLAEATDQRVLVERVDAILAVVLAALEFRARHEVLVAVHAPRLHARIVQRVQRAEGVVVETGIMRCADDLARQIPRRANPP